MGIFDAYMEFKEQAERMPDDQFPVPPSGKQQTKDLLEADVLYLMIFEKPGDYGVGHELVERGWNWKVIQDRLQRMDDKGLIEYGTSLFTPWLHHHLRDEIDIARGRYLPMFTVYVPYVWKPIVEPTHYQGI